jgi:nucleotide-binding universal stress UspA family protein
MTDARPIVVGYDGRAGSQAALDEAARLATQLGAPLVLVFSYEASRLGGEVRDLDATIEEHGRAVLAEGVARVGDTGVPVDVSQRTAAPDTGLLQEADERDAQMIVVGSTGEGPLRALIVGSTPYKLLHLSSRPLLIVRADG